MVPDLRHPVFTSARFFTSALRLRRTTEDAWGTNSGMQKRSGTLIFRFPLHFKESLWKASASGWVCTIEGHELQPYIDDKDAAIQSQKRRRGELWDYDELWLVLVAEWTSPSSFIRFTEQCNCTITEFNRIFGFARTYPIVEIGTNPGRTIRSPTRAL
jgi:hypothetical protein